MQTQISRDDLREMEALAVKLAGLAGSMITASLGQRISVQYKSGNEKNPFRDPVSELDREIESLIRSRVAETYPHHTIIGEEMDVRNGGGEFVWVIDPIDGTTNFVNGFPMFACTIGILHKKEPIIGAIWCSATHALRPGVYHAHAGGKLHFEAAELERPLNPDVRRGLCGVGSSGFRSGLPLDNRKTGSAALECAFCAVGLLQLSHFQSLNIWDVAGGICLVQAAGGKVLLREGSRWQPFERFERMHSAAAGTSELRYWRREVLLGQSSSAEAFQARR